MFFFSAALLNQIGSTKSSSSEQPKERVYPARRLQEALTFGLCAVMLLGSAVLSAQGAGTIFHGLAQSAEPAKAESYYQNSLRVFPASPATHFGYGIWLANNRRDEEAVTHLRYAVENGFNSSICYAYLAAAAQSAGDLAAAERTLATAVNVYPRSIFLLVSYSSVLMKAGRPETSKALFSQAVLLDARAARACCAGA